MIERAVEVLRTGGVVAFPTDTLYGLAVDPRSSSAVARLFAVKTRDIGHAIPLIAADMTQVERAARMTPLAHRLAASFWPGPLSIILAADAAIAADVCASDGSVAIRVPDNSVARQLTASFGYCVTATSANISGSLPTSDPVAVAAALGARIDFLLDAGPSAGGAPSTIVDARGPTIRLVRAGAIPWERVLESLQ